MAEEKIAARLIRLIGLTLLVQLIICHALWIDSQRVFPMVPSIKFLPVVWNPSTSVLLYFMLLASTVWLIIKPFGRWALVVLTVSYLLLLLEDISRLQPW